MTTNQKVAGSSPAERAKEIAAKCVKGPELMIGSPGPSQEVVVRPPVGKQPGLPEEHATKLPRAADTPNFANYNIKRLVAELPPTDRNGAPPLYA